MFFNQNRRLIDGKEELKREKRWAGRTEKRTQDRRRSKEQETLRVVEQETEKQREKEYNHPKFMNSPNQTRISPQIC